MEQLELKLALQHGLWALQTVATHAAPSQLSTLALFYLDTFSYSLLNMLSFSVQDFFQLCSHYVQSLYDNDIAAQRLHYCKEIIWVYS